MCNEWYLDRFADSIEDEEYIKEYQKNFAEDVKKILESEDKGSTGSRLATGIEQY